jgi:hypothetical protein
MLQIIDLDNSVSLLWSYTCDMFERLRIFPAGFLPLGNITCCSYYSLQFIAGFFGLTEQPQQDDQSLSYRIRV